MKKSKLKKHNLSLFFAELKRRVEKKDAEITIFKRDDFHKVCSYFDQLLEYNILENEGGKVDQVFLHRRLPSDCDNRAYVLQIGLGGVAGDVYDKDGQKKWTKEPSDVEFRPFYCAVRWQDGRILFGFHKLGSYALWKDVRDGLHTFLKSKQFDERAEWYIEGLSLKINQLHEYYAGAAVLKIEILSNDKQCEEYGTKTLQCVTIKKEFQGEWFEKLLFSNNQEEALKDLSFDPADGVITAKVRLKKGGAVQTVHINSDTISYIPLEREDFINNSTGHPHMDKLHAKAQEIFDELKQEKSDV